MAEEVPQLFDPVKAAAAMARAQRKEPARFLLDRLCEDLVERLSPVMRDFAPALDLGTPDRAFGRALVTAGRIETFDSAMPENMRETPSGNYGLIVSGGLLHATNDPPGLIAQARRALKPDGLFMAAFPGGETLHELRAVLMEAESEMRGAAGLRVFPMIEIRAAGALLQRAGLALPVADSEKITVRYRDMFALIRDLRAMGATATPLNRPGMPPLTRTITMRAAALYADRFSDKDGRIRATFEIIWLSGWAPHASQQKPLRPGSAKMSLEQALTRQKDREE